MCKWPGVGRLSDDSLTVLVSTLLQSWPPFNWIFLGEDNSLIPKVKHSLEIWTFPMNGAFKIFPLPPLSLESISMARKEE